MASVGCISTWSYPSPNASPLPTWRAMASHPKSFITIISACFTSNNPGHARSSYPYSELSLLFLSIWQEEGPNLYDVRLPIRMTPSSCGPVDQGAPSVNLPYLLHILCNCSRNTFQVIATYLLFCTLRRTKSPGPTLHRKVDVKGWPIDALMERGGGYTKHDATKEEVCDELYFVK